MGPTHGGITTSCELQGNLWCQTERGGRVQCIQDLDGVYQQACRGIHRHHDFPDAPGIHSVFEIGEQTDFFLSLTAFLLTGFQGWLGAKVVSFELHPVIVTLHMLLAIVIVFILLYVFTWAGYVEKVLTLREGSEKVLSGIGIAVMALSLFQILLGTQVREAMDLAIMKLGYGARSQWIDELGANFYIHRSFSILVFVVNVIWINRVLKTGNKGTVAGKIAIACLWILIAEIVTGVVMAYFGVPAFAQPIHLTFAILLIGLQFIVWLIVNGRKYLKYNGVALSGDSRV